jgi:hypothetical protein
MKTIVYTIDDSGVDGRERSRPIAAFFEEDDRNKAYKDMGANACYYQISERIIDTDKQSKEALGKLNGIDKLVLGVTDD